MMWSLMKPMEKESVWYTVIDENNKQNVLFLITFNLILVHFSDFKNGRIKQA